VIDTTGKISVSAETPAPVSGTSLFIPTGLHNELIQSQWMLAHVGYTYRVGSNTARRSALLPEHRSANIRGPIWNRGGACDAHVCPARRNVGGRRFCRERIHSRQPALSLLTRRPANRHRRGTGAPEQLVLWSSRSPSFVYWRSWIAVLHPVSGAW